MVKNVRIGDHETLGMNEIGVGFLMWEFGFERVDNTVG
jgi:hypothetical protein